MKTSLFCHKTVVNVSCFDVASLRNRRGFGTGGVWKTSTLSTRHGSLAYRLMSEISQSRRSTLALRCASLYSLNVTKSSLRDDGRDFLVRILLSSERSFKNPSCEEEADISRGCVWCLRIAARRCNLNFAISEERFWCRGQVDVDRWASGDFESEMSVAVSSRGLYVSTWSL